MRIDDEHYRIIDYRHRHQRDSFKNKKNIFKKCNHHHHHHQHIDRYLGPYWSIHIQCIRLLMYSFCPFPSSSKDKHRHKSTWSVGVSTQWIPKAIFVNSFDLWAQCSKQNCLRQQNFLIKFLQFIWWIIFEQSPFGYAYYC